MPRSRFLIPQNGASTAWRFHNMPDQEACRGEEEHYARGVLLQFAPCRREMIFRIHYRKRSVWATCMKRQFTIIRAYAQSIRAFTGFFPDLEIAWLITMLPLLLCCAIDERCRAARIFHYWCGETTSAVSTLKEGRLKRFLCACAQRFRIVDAAAQWRRGACILPLIYQYAMRAIPRRDMMDALIEHDFYFTARQEAHFAAAAGLLFAPMTVREFSFDLRLIAGLIDTLSPFRRLSLFLYFEARCCAAFASTISFFREIYFDQLREFSADARLAFITAKKFAFADERDIHMISARHVDTWKCCAYVHFASHLCALSNRSCFCLIAFLPLWQKHDDAFYTPLLCCRSAVLPRHRRSRHCLDFIDTPGLKAAPWLIAPWFLITMHCRREAPGRWRAGARWNFPPVPTATSRCLMAAAARQKFSACRDGHLFTPIQENDERQLIGCRAVARMAISRRLDAAAPGFDATTWPRPRRRAAARWAADARALPTTWALREPAGVRSPPYKALGWALRFCGMRDARTRSSLEISVEKALSGLRAHEYYIRLCEGFIVNYDSMKLQIAISRRYRWRCSRLPELTLEISGILLIVEEYVALTPAAAAEMNFPLAYILFTGLKMAHCHAGFEDYISSRFHMMDNHFAY